MSATPALEPGGAGGAPVPAAGGFARVLDSIVFPTHVRAHQDDRRVRPALAVLFRIAVGPRADYYARRFVRYERSGRGAPSWNWPAFALPTVWAFYRKLWAYGVVCALLPLLGALAFTGFDPVPGDWHFTWWASAALFCWLLPAVVCATFANTVYYRRVRRLVRRAEMKARTAEVAAKRLLQRGATDALLAVLLGTGILLCVGSVIGPWLQNAYHAFSMRGAVEQVLAAVRPLQSQVEDHWLQARAIPARLDYRAVRAHPGYELIDAIDLNVQTGRVRIDLGDAQPELAGRSILLAPVVDAWQKLHWLCVPIAIPAAYLPAACSP
jgi:hypothetical protein